MDVRTFSVGRGLDNGCVFSREVVVSKVTVFVIKIVACAPCRFT